MSLIPSNYVNLRKSNTMPSSSVVNNDLQCSGSIESSMLKSMPLVLHFMFPYYYLYHQNVIITFTGQYPTGGYGRSRNVPVVNLSTNQKSLIAYACSHIMFTFDYVSRKKKCFPGHKHQITCLSSDSLGMRLISSDYGEENTIIVWDLENYTPFTRFRSPPRTYISRVSHCGKYIVSVSLQDGLSSCYLWLVSRSINEAAGIVNFDSKLGDVLDIAFSLDLPYHFMLTTKKIALFFTWPSKNNETFIPGNLEVYIPPPLPEVFLENLQESVYLIHYPTCFTSTPDGFILVWDDERNKFRSKRYVPQTNKKTLIKWYKLQNDGIKVLRQLNEYIITGDDKGIIRIYDYNLRILYSTKGTHMTTGVLQIEMHLENREYFFRSTAAIKTIDQFTDKAIPTDCTKEGNAFIIQDFIVVDQDGCIYYFDFLKDCCFKIFDIPNSSVTSIDVHPERPVITIGNSLGVLTKINYISEEFIYSKSVSDFTTGPQNNIITCLKYSNSGEFIAIAMKNGAAFLVNSCLYNPMQEKPYAYTSTNIFKICFSPDDKYMAYADENYCISLYGCALISSEEKLTKRWIYCGRICLHSRRISDLKFDPLPTDSNRLFSIGWDHSLVEYSLGFRKNNGIGEISTDQIEQTAIPLSLTCSVNISGTKYLLITNSEETKEYHKTILGPIYDSPISCTVTVSDEIILFGTNLTIGLQMLPVDGNPFKTMGVLAHPVCLKAIAYEPKIRMLFTTGDNETCILTWRINERPLQRLYKQGGKGLEPYNNLIEGGAKGSFMQQAKEFFCLSKIFHRGFHCQHQMDSLIKFCDIANVLRSLGYYPSEKEIENMIKEVLLNLHDPEIKEIGKISFEDLICLYINHRPAKGISLQQITSSFEILSKGGPHISKDKLMEILTNEGEMKSRYEIPTYLQLLFDMRFSINGDNRSPSAEGNISQDLTQATFEDVILGIINHENNLMEQL